MPSFTLGVSDVNPVTMAGVYATFASRGIYCKPHPVTRIFDAQGKRVDTGTPPCDRVMGKPVADAVNDILRGVIEPGGFADDARAGPAVGRQDRHDQRQLRRSGSTATRPTWPPPR